MTSTEKRGLTAREAVLAYCTYPIQCAYLDCWPRPDEVNPDATTEEKKAARLAVASALMAMLRHEAPASESEPKQDPVVLQITGDLGSDSEPEIMAGSFLGTYGVLDIDTAGHWTYRAGEARLREVTENGPDWFAHYDRFFVTREDGSVQTLTITLSRHRNDEVKETKSFPTVGNRVPAETFGENNEPDLGLATARDLNRKLPGPDQSDKPAPVPLWVEGKPDDGMPRREVTQDELRHLRFYLEPDELSGGGLKFEGLLFFNAAERLAVVETKGSDKAALANKPTSTPDSEGGTLAPPPNKRGAGLKFGRYYSPLKKHLKWRKDNKKDLDTASLKELRTDAQNRLITDRVQDIPKSRSAFNHAIKTVLRELGVNR